ncbi:MAG: IS4 family transposase [Acidobacteriaceae bacterium]|nr:IS4 family transposase [Acidobacteriaceae bacterium]
MLIGRLRRRLRSRSTAERFRQRQQDFSRQRLLSFAAVVLLILRGHKLSLQNALNKLFTSLGQVFGVPTASAYCQARQKLKPELFQYLNESVCDDFYVLYEEEGRVHRWRSHRLLACDGTYLNLPDTPHTRQEFFLQTNQFQSGSAVQALSCILYDLLNEVALGASLSTREAETKPLLQQLWERTAEGDILILDRNFASYLLFATAIGSGRELVVRLSAHSFKQARKLFQRKRFHQPQYEQVVEIECPASALKVVREQGLAERVRLRLVSFRLETGEIEVLATTLLDEAQYPAAEFKWLYGKRWGAEGFIGRVKNILEAERFSGESPLVIRQDYYGVIFLATLESVLAASDRQRLSEQAAEKEAEEVALSPVQEEQHGVKQINHCVSYAALLERLIELLLSRRSTEKVLEEMHHLFRTSPSRARPHRRYGRPKEASHRSALLRYQKYVRKLIA